MFSVAQSPRRQGNDLGPLPRLARNRRCAGYQPPAADAVDGAHSTASKCQSWSREANHVEGSRPWARLALLALILRSHCIDNANWREQVPTQWRVIASAVAAGRPGMQLSPGSPTLVEANLRRGSLIRNAGSPLSEFNRGGAPASGSCVAKL
jgi:hypothetical protein